MNKKISKQNTEAIELLESWSEGNFQEQKETWEYLSEALIKSEDTSRLNPLIESASGRAQEAAKQWIVWARNNFPAMPPYIVTSGDGGIIVEWKINDDFVSVNFDQADPETDFIFSKSNSQKISDDFSEGKLTVLLTKLISYKAASFDLLNKKIDDLLSGENGDYDDEFKRPSEYSVRMMKDLMNSVCDSPEFRKVPATFSRCRVKFIANGKGGIEAIVRKGNKVLHVVAPPDVHIKPYVFKKDGPNHQIIKFRSSEELNSLFEWVL